MAMPALTGRRFESRQRNRNRKIEVWEILCRLFVVLFICCGFLVGDVDCLGSMSTVAASYGGNTNSTTVCALVEGAKLRCWHSGRNVSDDLLPKFRFAGISGGSGVVCGLVEGGVELYCWNTDDMQLRRPSNGTRLSEMAVGETQICGLNESNGEVISWRWKNEGDAPVVGFSDIAVGTDFACGIQNSSRTVKCWGPNAPTEKEPSEAMVSISAGVSHACGITATGRVICWGGSNSNSSGLLNVTEHEDFEFDSLALGANHTCLRRRINGTILCWGSPNITHGYPQNIDFQTIVSADEYVCGIVTSNLTVLCFGNERFGDSTLITELNNSLPGRCEPNEFSCPCGQYLNSNHLCGGSFQICQPCSPPQPPAEAPPPRLPEAPTPANPVTKTKKSKATIPLLVAGSVGVFMGLCSIISCVYVVFFRRSMRRSGRVFDAEQPGNQSSSPAASRRTSRQNSRTVRRQRSGTSKPFDRPEEFTLADLANATSNFSDSSKLGAGSFGTVYRGILPDGRNVAIKRSETRTSKKYQENASAFESELNFLSRLHHKHLVALVGYCEEDDERLLVYEYMSNGSFYDHLHKAEQIIPPLDSWAMRIKLAVDAARGVEYLHTYAVPPIIHRDIKSSNILLDSLWNAKVADFGLSLLGPEDEDSHLSLMAAGTVGYIDPEYYKMQHLTTKSDVYSFGVVLMEMLTGKKAIHRHDGSGGSTPRNVVDYALPYIVNDDLASILDGRLPPPRPYEIEAVSFVGSTAADCVNLEGKDRPTMTEVVGNLETALAFCVQGARSVDSRSRSLHGSDDDFGVRL